MFRERGSLLRDIRQEGRAEQSENILSALTETIGPTNAVE